MSSNADLMKLWRRLREINTAEAGRRLGMSPRAIEDIEQGRRRAEDVLTRLALEALVHEAAHEHECRSAALAAANEREKKSKKSRNPS